MVGPRCPHRVRLHRGRNTHAARELPISGGHETACDYVLDDGASNHWLPWVTPVTCPGCKRALAKAGA